MIAKKNSDLNLEKNRRVFTQVGLLVVGSLALAAFSYRSPYERASEEKAIRISEVTYEIQQEIKDEPIIEPIRNNTPQNNNQSQQRFENNTQIPDENSSVTNNTQNLPDPNNLRLGLPNIPTGPPVVSPIGDIIDIVDIDAKYVGGNVEMQKFIIDNVVYPETSKDIGEQGTVYVSFVVEVDGRITNIDIARGVSNDLDREAKRVVKKFPKWIPGELNYKKVRTRVRLPITFLLD